ncbi:MAG TPA: response regulator transcription factor [Acidimicrobiales bacterium]|nr:response regulator transcription factor [Acidimicrobiales bacterium]
MAGATASIMIVDDHPVIGDSMAMALRAHGFEPVVAVPPEDLSVSTVVGTARSVEPGIVMLDLFLGGDQVSVPMIAPLVELGAKVIVFTASNDPRLTVACLRAGAEAVLNKAAAFDQVLSTLKDLATGRELMPPEERDALIEALDERSAEERERLRPFDALTEREAQVLRRLIDGESPKQIARDEAISLSTVRSHVERIYRKLGVNNQRQALGLARAAGWPAAGTDDGARSAGL